MKVTILLLVLMLKAVIVFGQKSQFQQYIIFRDSMIYQQGQIIYNPQIPNSVSFKRFKNDPFKVYLPKEIAEFAIEDDIYVYSSLIEGEYKFLKTLFRGDKELLILKGSKEEDRFFVKKDSIYEELTKDNYKYWLEEVFSEKDYIHEIVEDARMKHKDLSRIFKYGYSSSTYFPTFRIGVLLGISNKKMSIKEASHAFSGPVIADLFRKDSPRINLFPETDLMIGFFMDSPISFSRFSIRLEGIYSQSRYTNSQKKGYYEKLDYFVNLKSIEIPLLLRYRFKSQFRNHFFANAGTSFILHNVQDNRVINTTEGSEAKIFALSIPNNTFGGIIGVGTEYSLNNKNKLAVELRYNFDSGASDEMIINSLQLMTSFNF